MPKDHLCEKKNLGKKPKKMGRPRTLESIRTIDYIPVGSGPESFAVSPDSKLLAVDVVQQRVRVGLEDSY